MFTRRHYRSIARAMQSCMPEPGFGTCDAERACEHDQWLNSIAALVTVFKADNTCFSSDKFEEACHKST